MHIDEREGSPLETVKSLLAALSRGDREAAMAFYDPGIEQHEFPNRLVPQGAHRGLPELRAASERGADAVSDEMYSVRNAVVSGQAVALEVDWSATLKVPCGSLPAGGVLRASLAIFFEVRAGRIVRQHNYDCFEPF